MPHKLYKKPFLNEVIMRADFLSEIGELKNRLRKDIGDAIMKNYPILEPKDVVKFPLNVPQGKQRNIDYAFREWAFHSKDRQNTLTLTKDSVFIKISKYGNYEKVKTDFLLVANMLFDTFEELQVKRLGLRYINEITIKGTNPLDWNEWLVKKYLYPMSKFPDNANLSRVFNNIELNYDDYFLRINFGLHNPDFPAKIKKKNYVLDFDAYTSDILVKEDLPIKLDVFHAKIENLFESFITDKLREKMK